jgi:hypothetical protein
MGIPESPQAGRPNADSQEGASATEALREAALPGVPDQGGVLGSEVQQTALPDMTRLHKGMGTKCKASGLQKGKAPKRPSVEEGDDFLLNEISHAAQNLGPPEFTLRGEPLCPLNASYETREGSDSLPAYPPSSSTQAHAEEFTEASRLVSPEVLLRSPTPGSEEDLQGKEPEQCTTVDPGTSVPNDTLLRGTSFPGTSEAGPSGASRSFDFLGVCLLCDPLEALASILHDRLFEDCQENYAFQIRLRHRRIPNRDIFLLPSTSTCFLFLLLFVNCFLHFRIPFEPSLPSLTSSPTSRLSSVLKSIVLSISWCLKTRSLPA